MQAGLEFRLMATTFGTRRCPTAAYVESVLRTLTQCLQMSVRPSASGALMSWGGASTRSLCPYGVRHHSTNRRFVPINSCGTKEEVQGGEAEGK